MRARKGRTWHGPTAGRRNGAIARRKKSRWLEVLRMERGNNVTAPLEDVIVLAHKQSRRTHVSYTAVVLIGRMLRC